jgi:hypothetical protein
MGLVGARCIDSDVVTIGCDIARASCNRPDVSLDRERDSLLSITRRMRLAEDLSIDAYLIHRWCRPGIASLRDVRQLVREQPARLRRPFVERRRENDGSIDRERVGTRRARQLRCSRASIDRHRRRVDGDKRTQEPARLS